MYLLFQEFKLILLQKEILLMFSFYTKSDIFNLK